MTDLQATPVDAGLALTVAMARCSANAASAWADEVGRFVGHRLAADAEYLTALGSAPSPMAAAEMTAAFMNGVAADYMAFARDASLAMLAAPSSALSSTMDGFAPPGPLPIE